MSESERETEKNVLTWKENLLLVVMSSSTWKQTDHNNKIMKVCFHQKKLSFAVTI